MFLQNGDLFFPHSRRFSKFYKNSTALLVLLPDIPLIPFTLCVDIGLSVRPFVEMSELQA